jgi:hypothetical protein
MQGVHPPLAFAAILTLIVAVGAQAGETKRPPHMTGNQFIAELRGESNAQRLFDKPYAQGYLAGVVDATQSRSWCLPSDVSPDAADKQVLDELAKRPVGSMPNLASAILIEQYRIKFPAKNTPCSFPPRMSGNEFATWAIGNRRKSSAEKANPSPEVQERERFAEGYIGGTVDATQGTDWCAPSRIKPDELDAVGYWGLVEQPAGSMPGNAATLLLQQFITKYPCRSQP